jgi:signal transduction histidine kinase
LRRATFGLRLRLVAALVLTAAVTLGVAAVAVLSPLQNRLRRDTSNTLVSAASSARPTFIRLLADGGPWAPARTHHQATALARRVGAQVTVIRVRTLAVVTTTDADDPGTHDPGSLSAVAAASSNDRTTRTVSGSQVQVVVPMTAGGRHYAMLVRKRLTEVTSATRVVSDAFVTAALVGLAIASILGLALATGLLRRLERLRDATRHVAEEHGEAPALQDTRRDEIGELTRSFAAMQSHLRRQEEARRSFVSVASHELRTPLASLHGMLEMLGEDLAQEGFDPADARRQVAEAQEQSLRLSQLATDLLDLSRLDAQVELRSEPIELGELARAVAAEFAARAAERRVTLDVDPVQVWATADPGAAARIVRILVDNALRFAPDGDRVTVTPDGRGGAADRAAIAVCDGGPGIPEGERDIVFERFQRGSSTGGSGGFGLGLAIGRELAERMGGTLELDPEPAGARLVLSLPAADPAALNAIPT